MNRFSKFGGIFALFTTPRFTQLCKPGYRWWTVVEMWVNGRRAVILGEQSSRSNCRAARMLLTEKSSWCRYHKLSLCLNRICTGQSSDSERARDQWRCAAVNPQVNLSFSFVSRVSKHVTECIAVLVSIVVSAIPVFRLVDNNLSSSLHC